MRRTTKFAIAAMATALMGSTAIAADLGGNCCADLEERIAELEATTARKGNRKVSLTISGHVGHYLMLWDDGTQSDMYIGDGGNIFSRFRFVGQAKISPELTAGFLYEFGVNQNAIGSMNQLNGSGATSNTGLNGDDAGAAANPLLRDTTVWLRHARLGMVKIGHGSTSTDNLVLIDLGTRDAAGTMDIALYNGGFILRSEGGTLASATNMNWNAVTRGHESWDTSRRNHILYETPALHGFTVQAAVAEDNYWDVALRYAGEFNGVRVAFGIGYQEDTEFNAPAGLLDVNGALCTTLCDAKTTDLKGSASVLHVPTGLFLTVAGGVRELEGSRDTTAGGRYAGPDLKTWHIAGGIRRNFFGYGPTVLFGEYTWAEGGLEQASFLGTVSNYSLNTVATGSTSSEMTQWGIGINQYIDAAAMQVFVTYKNWSMEANGFSAATTVPCSGNAILNKGCLATSRPS
ncbi:MAG TPA: hypothetical protein VFV47_03285 [Hyphomicrobiaceae bacterium]|nr:hypothetical protein [Hyphomicrobiaceae bacterium]